MTRRDETLEQSQAMNHLLLEMVKTQKENNKSLTKAFIATIICYTALLIAVVVGFFLYESQFKVAEKSIATEVITQEGCTENSEIYNVGGNLHNEERGTE